MRANYLKSNIIGNAKIFIKRLSCFLVSPSYVVPVGYENRAFLELIKNAVPEESFALSKYISIYKTRIELYLFPRNLGII